MVYGRKNSKVLPFMYDMKIDRRLELELRLLFRVLYFLITRCLTTKQQQQQQHHRRQQIEDRKRTKTNQCIYKECGQMIEINYLLELNDTKAEV
jgi:hypothetical protein